MKHGARLVIRTIAGLVDNSITPQLQSGFLKPGEIPKKAPKIFPEDCVINWNQDPRTIHNFIRGLSPSPCAKSFFIIGNEKLTLKIFESQPETGEHSFKSGSIVSDGKHFIKVACNNGFINIVNLQLEGKKRMSTVEFLRGFNISKCTIAVS
jgi:methionyl-tRNA formyltransferase